MTALFIVGALLWTVVLFAVLRRLAERRQAQRRWQADRAEAERLWWQCENERYESLREMQYVMVLRKLEEWRMKPNPGSDAAIKQGCTCPVMDNAHGRRNDGLFWINADCPVHGCRPVAMTQHQLERLAQAERMMQV